MVTFISLILGAPAFAKAPEQSKGIEMKNAHASDQAKDKANPNAGFEKATETDDVEEPPVEECAEGTTGTFPDCVEDPYVCPSGTVGTFPFCAQAS